jgi:uncharacterized iron-regulated membrane protein
MKLSPAESFWNRLTDQPRKLSGRKSVAWLHRAAGLTFGAFLLVMGLSGAALVFKDQLEVLIAPSLMRSATPSATISLDSLVAAACRYYPGRKSIFVDLGTQPAAAVYLARNGAWYPASAVETVYVDRGTGQVRGMRNYATGLLNRLMHLHTELWMGAGGAVWLGALALLLFMMIATGYLLWWPGRAGWKRAAQFSWRARWPRRTWDLHQCAGFYGGLPLAMQAATAVALTLPIIALPVLAAILPGSLAELHRFENPPRSSIRTAHTENLMLQQMAEQALVLYPAYRIQNVTLPIAPDDPVVFVLGDDAYTRRGAQAKLAFDATTGALLSDMDTRRGSMLLRTYVLLGPLHFGRLFGAWTQTLWAFLGFAPATLFATGFAMWWRRMPIKRLRRS